MAGVLRQSKLKTKCSVQYYLQFCDILKRRKKEKKAGRNHAPPLPSPSFTEGGKAGPGVARIGVGELALIPSPAALEKAGLAPHLSGTTEQVLLIGWRS